MIVSVNFDTQTKALDVNLDGKKMDNVSEIQFYTFNEQGSIEIRQCEMLEEEKCYKITKIIANEQNEYEVKEEIDDSPLVKDMIKVLFRGRK